MLCIPFLSGWHVLTRSLCPELAEGLSMLDFWYA